MKKILYFIITVTGLSVLLLLIAFKTDLFLADLILPFQNNTKKLEKLVHDTEKVYGQLEQWNKLNRVTLKVEGSIPFFPARLGLNAAPGPVKITVQYKPSEYGRYFIEYKDTEDSFSGNIRTDKNRTRRGLLIDSIRHLFELSFSPQKILVLKLAEGKPWKNEPYSRLFATYHSIEPQSDVDQLLFWIKTSPGSRGRIPRVDTTGRDITPWTKARIEITGLRAVNGFRIPENVTVYRLNSQSVIHKWKLTGIALE